MPDSTTAPAAPLPACRPDVPRSRQTPVPAHPGPDTNPLGPVDPDRQPVDLRRLLRALGVDPVPVVRLPSSTSQVYRLVGHGLVLRVAGPDATPDQLELHLRVADTLAGVLPFARPASLAPASSGPVHATLWFDDGPGGPLDPAMFGFSAALLHTRAAGAVRAAGLTLPDASSAASAVERVGVLRRAGQVTRDEDRFVRAWADLTARWSAGRPPVPQVVVHDDLWDKNVVQLPDRAVLVDPDNVGWGPADHDLAFIRRAALQHPRPGGLSAAHVARFTAGYRRVSPGTALPSPGDAAMLAVPHELRWLVQNYGRRSGSVQAGRYAAETVRALGPPPAVP